MKTWFSTLALATPSKPTAVGQTNEVLSEIVDALEEDRRHRCIRWHDHRDHGRHEDWSGVGRFSVLRQLAPELDTTPPSPNARFLPANRQILDAQT
jgi:hypothetical protein